MWRPRKNPDMTPENLLSRMADGTTYQATQLAAKFYVSTAEIRPLINAMVTAGQLLVGRADATHIGFKKPVAIEPPVAPVVAVVVDDMTLTIALRMGPPDLKSTMTGYDAEIARRQQLCMLARGAR